MYRAFANGLTNRRVLVTDTITILEPEDRGAIVVSGSHGGLSSAQFALGHGLAAVFYSDAGFGRDHAGTAGLAVLDQVQLAALAFGHESAAIGDGRDAWHNGIVTAVNATATAAGARVGMRVQEAALGIHLVDAAEQSAAMPQLRRTARRVGPHDVVVVDSISMLTAADGGQLVASGSHGAVVSAEFALRFRPSLAVFNDAGGGKNGAGWAALPTLDAANIASVAVAADTGRIGDPNDMLDHGVVSRVNTAAKRLGVVEGRPLAAQIAALAV